MSQTVLAYAGFAMITLFMYLIMSKRMTAMNALVLIPIIFAVGLGFHGAGIPVCHAWGAVGHTDY